MKEKHLSLLECAKAGDGKRRQLPDQMVSALNDQLALELESAYLYLGISTYFANQDLPGFASWFRLQSREEYEHFERVYNYLLDRDADVVLPVLPGVETHFESILDAVMLGMAHEEQISLKVNELYGLAQGLGEFDTAVFLQWFLQEQVEEESTFRSLVQQLKRIENSADLAPLLLLDRELGQRTDGHDHEK